MLSLIKVSSKLASLITKTLYTSSVYLRIFYIHITYSLSEVSPQSAITKPIYDLKLNIHRYTTANMISLSYSAYLRAYTSTVDNIEVSPHMFFAFSLLSFCVIIEWHSLHASVHYIVAMNSVTNYISYILCDINPINLNTFTNGSRWSPSVFYHTMWILYELNTRCRLILYSLSIIIILDVEISDKCRS